MLSLPQNDRHFAKLGGGGLDKGDFYFKQIYIKNLKREIWVNQIILICYEYIKINSHINLGDGSHIRIVLSCSNAVKTHNVNIFH